MNTPLDLTVELDKFGRILIPKKMRERLNLAAGEKVNLRLENNALTLKAAARATQWVEEDGLMVFSTGGKPLEGDLVGEMREARIRESW